MNSVDGKRKVGLERIVDFVHRVGSDLAFMHIGRCHKTINWSTMVHFMDYKCGLCTIAIDSMGWQTSCRLQGCWIKSTKWLERDEGGDMQEPIFNLLIVLEILAKKGTKK